ncbi:MAG: DNA polymerase III subunit delta [Firmicutes bacterium]|nr:DNA polymerase III subunit delta [Bacillota bacterium]
MTFEQIMTGLKSRKYYPVYFLTGEEPYFLDAISDYISENLLSETEKTFNQVIMYGKDSSVYSVLDAAKRFPMMSSFQVVIVKEAQNLKEIDKLQFYLEKPLKSTILVICYKDKIDKRLKLFKNIEKSKDIAFFESKKLYDNQVQTWINNFLSENGLSIVPVATSLLTEYIGTELNKIVNELNKLMISLSPNEKKITIEHIEKNIGISKDYNVFELIKAIGEKNILKANCIINHFSRNPKSKENETVDVVRFLYSNFFIKLLKYHYLTDKGQSTVASALGINPYFVKEYEFASRKYPAPKIIQIISILREYDLKAKGVGNYSASNGDLMKEMIYKILH